MLYTFISIGIAAAIGTWIRWGLNFNLNSIFPRIPLGTSTANILGGFLIGIFMSLTKNNMILSETMRLTIMTGFLCGLTTFSTFSAETVTLLSHQEYLWALVLIVAHLIGSVTATIFGICITKLFIT